MSRTSLCILPAHTTGWCRSSSPRARRRFWRGPALHLLPATSSAETRAGRRPRRPRAAPPSRRAAAALCRAKYARRRRFMARRRRRRLRSAASAPLARRPRRLVGACAATAANAPGAPPSVSRTATSQPQRWRRPARRRPRRLRPGTSDAASAGPRRRSWPRRAPRRRKADVPRATAATRLDPAADVRVVVGPGRLAQHRPPCRAAASARALPRRPARGPCPEPLSRTRRFAPSHGHIDGPHRVAPSLKGATRGAAPRATAFRDSGLRPGVRETRRLASAAVSSSSARRRRASARWSSSSRATGAAHPSRTVAPQPSGPRARRSPARSAATACSTRRHTRRARRRPHRRTWRARRSPQRAPSWRSTCGAARSWLRANERRSRGGRVAAPLARRRRPRWRGGIVGLSSIDGVKVMAWRSSSLVG